MGKHVTVEEGDSLLSLAHAEGFLDPQTVWEDSGNDELRSKRPNPGVLAPGDQIFFPDKQEGRCEVPAGASHKFQLKKIQAYFSIFLHDECGQAYAGCRYKLVVEDETFEGTTGSDGLVCHQIPPNARTGKLTLWPNPNRPEQSHEWDVQVGDMDPTETVRGIKGRLRNLGYTVGDLNDEMDDETKNALREFQRHLGQDHPTGELDDATRSALFSLHHEQ